jgi:two-component system phosphate regulon sensor histidine kinase PhoR
MIVFQIFWVYQTYLATEKQFNQRVKIALYDVAEKLTEFNRTQMPFHNPVEQVSSNYFIVNVEDVIDPIILEHFLKTGFDHNNITLDYEYAIYDCESKEMFYGNYISPVSDHTSPSNLRTFKKDNNLVYYFGVNFPTKTTYIVQNMNIWFISSLIILTALSFFAYSLFIILKQRKLSDVQKDFINNMTHEFKTPISTIAIASGVLSDPLIINNPQRLHNYATIISEQNTRLEHHIEKVLQEAGSDRSAIKLKLEQIEIHDLITHVVSNFKMNQAQINITINCDLPINSIYFNGDRLHLSNVIYNLLDNAVKYCDTDPVISVTAGYSKNILFISVMDNGRGIEKQYLNKIFERFFRVPTGDVHNVKGFGLGLNYVKNIIESHNWKIQVKSQIGIGSIFTILIKNKYSGNAK